MVRSLTGLFGGDSLLTHAGIVMIARQTLTQAWEFTRGKVSTLVGSLTRVFGVDTFHARSCVVVEIGGAFTRTKCVVTSSIGRALVVAMTVVIYWYPRLTQTAILVEIYKTLTGAVLTTR